jgi:SAM-dependent MidA family methyltransferase
MHNLPLPPPDAIAHSQQLINKIRQAMNGEAIPFVKFMEQALYAPGLGYYSAGIHKLGAKGDFITAPEISPLFSHCVAKQCQPILASFENGVILEFGAGSGKMAAEILKALERLDCLPIQYLILEVSADLQNYQQETLQTQVPHLFHRIQWLERLPSQPISGVILANEVLDAMPVRRFRLDDNEISEFFVGIKKSPLTPLFQSEELSEDAKINFELQSPFGWQILPCRDESLRVAVEKLRPTLPIGYISEINLALPAFLQSVSDILAAGMVLLIDYGFPRREYYHPQRAQGTLMCHYRHYAHDDPLILVGLQDITAHVDFTAVAEAAVAADLSVAGYTTQANFLLASGLPEFLSGLDPNDTKTFLQYTQQVKKLTLPSEMGELFKVMALTRQYEKPLLGFVQDQRVKL